MGKGIEDMFNQLGKKQLEDEQRELEKAEDIIEDTIIEEVEEIEDVVEEVEDVVEEVEDVVEETEEEEDIIISEEIEEVIEDKEISEEDFLKFASSKLGREIKSLDDLESKQEVEELSEQVKAINDFVKATGRDANDWFTVNSLDIEGMDNEQLVKENMRLKYPELTDSQIERRFNKLYKLDSELHEADEVEDSKIELAIAAREAKGVLGEWAKQYTAPIVKTPEADTAEQKAEFDRLKSAYIADMEVAVDKIETFAFDVDGATVKYKPSKEDIAKIKHANQNLETFFEEFKNEAGEFDFEELSLAMHFRKKENVAKLIKAVRGRYVSEGKDSEISKRKNTKLPGNTGAESEETTEQTQVKSTFTETLLKEMGGRKKMKIKF